MKMPSEISIRPARCKAGIILPLLPAGQTSSLLETGYLSYQPCHLHNEPAMRLRVGTVLGSLEDPKNPAFQVVGSAYIPGILQPCPLLRSLTNWLVKTDTSGLPHEKAPHDEDRLSEYSYVLPVSRPGYAMACITMSDKGYAGQREDLSGPAMAALIPPVLPLCHSQRFLLPDEPSALRALVLELATTQGYDLILVTGGTGLAPRDMTPEALVPVLNRRLPGFEQRMMATSLDITPHAALARLVAGTIGSSLVIALPGSIRAATENLDAILKAIPHAMEKLKGDPADCGSLPPQ